MPLTFGVLLTPTDCMQVGRLIFKIGLDLSRTDDSWKGAATYITED